MTRPDLRAAPRSCPSCSSGLFIERLRCAECDTAVEGRFSGTADWPQRLSADQLAFVRVFMDARGKIKDVEAALGLSYPTVVSRLDDVVAAINGTPAAERRAPDRRKQILDDLAAGVIDVEEAARRLKKA